MKYKTRILFMGILFYLMIGCSKPIQWTFQNVPYGDDERQTFNIIMPKDKTMSTRFFIFTEVFIIQEISCGIPCF
jgi:hypothetical protein